MARNEQYGFNAVGPYEVNHTFTHYGGVAEYNAMIGQEGGADFD